MKLSFWTIIIMAVSVAFAILSFAILHQTLPTLKMAEEYEKYQGLLDTEIGKERRAKQRVDKAMQDVQRASDKWNGYVAVRTPATSVPEGGINLAVNPYQLSVDTQKFRNSVQRAVNAQVKKGGVRVVQGPQVPDPGTADDPNTLLTNYYNYTSLGFPAVIFDFGPITVEGTYEQIMANVRSYKSMPRYLAVADGLQITGTSPNLTGTYNLTIVGFIRGKNIFPPIPAGGAPAVGGMPGGMPGMPPGMPGRGGPGMPPGYPGGPGGPGGAGAER
jgi:hypothetical protein